MRFWHFVFSSLLCAACATQSGASTSLVARLVPPVTVITDASYPDAVRSFERMPAQAKERAELRDRLAAHWIQKADAAIAADKYADVISALSEVSVLYPPHEWASGAIPAGLERIAQFLAKKGSPRGDEARVLSALMILKLLHP